jgi:uncharacterized sulfatase
MKYTIKTSLLIILISTNFSFGQQSKSLRKPQDKPNIIVIYTDDHGYADMGEQGVLKDLKTPNVDALAQSGIRATSGYSTAPQCVPSRSGLLAGRFQSKFGMESNASEHSLVENENSIAKRLKKAGYVTAQFGKWHMGKTMDIVKNGFDYIYPQNSAGKFPSNIDMNGNERPLQIYDTEGYHLETCSKAASAIIKKHKNDPFFLYVAYRAPHVPLDAPKRYEDRFPGDMPERRRKALAMLSAVDDGVGLIMNTLKEENLLENTLVFYIGDNGAPYKVFKKDLPGRGKGWNGSLNDPLNGEKGTLIEGGMRVPYLVSWKGVLPEGVVYDNPISTLDVAATSVALAGLPEDKKMLDGVNIIPYLSGDKKEAPHEFLAWRWLSQSAIRKGDWKYLVGGGDKEYLYNIENDISEKNNLIDKEFKIAKELRAQLVTWTNTLSPTGLSTTKGYGAWWSYYQYYLDGIESENLRKITAAQTKDKPKKKKK